MDRVAARLGVTELALDDLSVEATFRLSVDQLSRGDDRSALLFRLLGVLDAATVTDAVAACLLDVDRAEAATALRHLARVHLIEPVADGRYSMHDLLRAYAADQAGALDAALRTVAFDRVLSWCLAAARRSLALIIGQQATGGDSELTTANDAMTWGHAERDNLVALIRQALAGRDTTERGLALVRAMNWMFLDRAYNQRWEQNLELARHAARRLGDVRAEAAMTASLANSMSNHAPAACAELYRASIDLGRTAGDRTVITGTLINFGANQHKLGRLAEATELYEQARIEARGFSPRVEGYALANLAAVYRQLGQTSRAVDSARGAIAVAREVGDACLEAQALDDLADTYRAADDLDAALAAATSALELARAINDTGITAKASAGLGAILVARKDTAGAMDALTEAAAVFEANGLNHELGTTLRLLGETHLAAGDRTAGAHCLRQALTLLDQLGVPAADEVRALLE
jgi:tetratricopeptide (TPR) repeat protein